MKNVLKNIMLLFVALIVAYLLSPMMGEFYGMLFGQLGSWIDVGAIIGFPLVYIFFLTLIFTAFGDERKNSWIGILLIPAGMAEVYLDVVHIYFPLALGLLGWGIGFGISKLTTKLSSRT